MPADTKAKILVIKPVLPFPPNQGTKVVTFGLLRALQREFDVTVLARILSLDELDDVRQLKNWCTRVEVVLAPNRRSALHRVAYKIYYNFLSLFFRRSLKGLYDCPGALVDAARELADEDFDLVIVEYWQLHKMLDVFPREKCILLTHDIDLLVNRQVSLLERNLMRKLEAIQRWMLEQKEEIAAYRKARCVWTLTERDKLAVESLSRSNVEVDVMPFGLDVDYHAPSGMRRNPGEVLFMGYLGALFNLDALDYFIHKIHPHLDGVDGLSVTILGGDLPRELEHFALRSEVEVVGTVGDVRPYLHRAACLVIPLRFGGGLRIRVLEAMSAGVPIVCSRIAVAGMPFEAEIHYLEAGSPEEFGRQIRRVLGDLGLSERLAAAASVRVREAYGEAEQSRRVVEMARKRLQTR